MKYQVREKIFRLGEDNDILNEAGQPVLQVDGKVFSLRGVMIVNDLAGNEVGQVSRKLVSLLATYDISLTGGVSAEVHQRFSGPFHPKWTISVTGGADMEMTGNFAGHDFILTENGQTVATVSKAWISLADSYGVDIVDGQNDLLILCSVLALEAEPCSPEEAYLNCVRAIVHSQARGITRRQLVKFCAATLATLA